MTELDYEHECSRAELLGLPKPSRQEFFSQIKDTETEENSEREEVTAEQAEDEEGKREGFRRIGGGLDELNSILTNTQKKLNSFKTLCGSFSNLLKFQMGNKKDNEIEKPVEVSLEKNENQSDMSSKPTQDTHLNILDSLIGKAERAEVSLSSQNKQMKKFLN